MRYGGFMIDMDGTVYKGGDLIPGAVEFISALKTKGIPFVFLTNNSSATRSHYYEKLRRMGFDVGIENVLTSAMAAARFIADERKGKRVYAVASEAVRDEIRSAGVDVVEDDPDIVLLTFDRTITYEKINKAYRYLCGGAEFIATHPDDLCPTEDSYDIDIGPFIRMFEQMCQTSAIVIGKPNASMLLMAASHMGVDPSVTAMVGDRLYTDIEMAVRAGIGSILVLSGETSREQLEASGMHPTHVLGSVAEIPDLLERTIYSICARHPEACRGRPFIALKTVLPMRVSSFLYSLYIKDALHRVACVYTRVWDATLRAATVRAIPLNGGVGCT